jgi:hypothetical protein
VVPLAREATRQAGYRVVLISLEVWSNGVDLRYALVTLVPQVSFPVAGATHRWRLSDDLDTAYELSGVASGAGRTVHLHQLSFQPAPPADASTLTLTLTDEQDAAVATVEVPLAGEEPA